MKINKANKDHTEKKLSIPWNWSLKIVGLSTISAIRQCFFANLTTTLTHLPISSGVFGTKTCKNNKCLFK